MTPESIEAIVKEAVTQAQAPLHERLNTLEDRVDALNKQVQRLATNQMATNLQSKQIQSDQQAQREDYESIATRIARIEAHLGVDGGIPPVGSVLWTLQSIDKRLDGIEAMHAKLNTYYDIASMLSARAWKLIAAIIAVLIGGDLASKAIEVINRMMGQ